MSKGYIRRIDFITLLVAGPLLLLLDEGGVHAATLRTETTVTASIVTLGDVLDDAGEARTVQVASAPAPGDRQVLSTRAIARIATDNGLDIENPYNLAGVGVTRAGKAISHATISQSIAEAIQAQGDTGDKSIQLSGVQGSLYVPMEAAETVAVKDLNYNRTTGAFSATITASSENGRTVSAAVMGRATDVVNIPVLTRALSRGDIVAKSDIDWLQVSPTQVQGSVVSDANDLIGKSVRRPLRAGLAIRAGDVQEPVLVGKNALVTLMATTPNMTLTTVGRSLDEGAEGDVIRVMNSQSHKIVQGVVVSANEVRVDVSSRFAALSR
jgi:flagellar basal body P-ring formation protein FlgA